MKRGKGEKMLKGEKREKREMREGDMKERRLSLGQKIAWQEPLAYMC